jgi:poly(ADP-ribose) glycohydrolase ARH3
MWPDSYENTISRAITMGDDTDTLAAIAGALSGARLGVQGIPQQLLNILENGPKGRDYIVQVADNLYARWSDSTTRVGSGQTQ